MTKLQRDAIIAAALDLLDETGAENLTTRRLAERLGVQQPALYWHFRSKRALLDALAHAMLAEGRQGARPRPGQDWREFLADNARGFRRALLSRRDGALIHAGTRPVDPEFDAVEAQFALMREAGFAPLDAAHALTTVGHYVVGAVLEEQAAAVEAGSRPADAPPAALAEVFDAYDRAGPEAAFEFGLDVILDGLAARLARRALAPSGG